MVLEKVQIVHTREINKILSTEMDVLRKSARNSRMQRIKKELIKEVQTRPKPSDF